MAATKESQKTTKATVAANAATASTEKVVKVIRCVVVSDKMNKSRVGVFESLVKNSRYHKYMRRRTKYMFHDEKNETKIGDTVEIIQCRPLSSKKTFALQRVVKVAE